MTSLINNDKMNKEKLPNQLRLLIAIIRNSLMQEICIKNTKELVELANQSNIIPGSHYSSFKDLYDVAEFALNSHARSKLSPAIQENINTLIQLQGLLPCETERSVDQSIYQQFSTPLFIAYIMTLLSRPSASDNYLEPSAGTGTLTAFLPYYNSKIYVNELHPFRHSLLSISNYYDQSFRENATQIHNMPKFHDLNINKIIMNPPFSRDVNTNSKIDIFAGANHLISAFKLLKSRGTIVALMNSNFKSGSKAFKYFLKSAPGAKISFNAQLDSSTFQIKGTKFSTRILVIHNYDPGFPIHTPKALNQDTIQEYLNLFS